MSFICAVEESFNFFPCCNPSTLHASLQNVNQGILVRLLKENNLLVLASRLLICWSPEQKYKNSNWNLFELWIETHPQIFRPLQLSWLRIWGSSPLSSVLENFKGRETSFLSPWIASPSLFHSRQYYLRVNTSQSYFELVTPQTFFLQLD